MPETNATCNQCGYRGIREGKRKWCPACYDGDGEPGKLILDSDRPKMREPWWCIHGDVLLAALREARDGGDPDLIYAELFANTERGADD